jgi:hypothetical protein
MTVTSAAVRLPRFASGETVPKFANPAFRPLNEKPAPPPEADGLAERNAAVAEALEAARAEFDAARAADLAEFERRLAEREAEIHAAIGEALAARLAEGLAAVEERVGRQVDTVLLRFLDRAVRERAVSELGEAVSALLAGGTAARVRIAGPAALIDRVAAAIAPTGVPVERAEEDAADVSVTIDDTVVETNMAAWMDRLMSQAGAADDG